MLIIIPVLCCLVTGFCNVNGHHIMELALLSRTALTIQNLLCFHLHFRIVSSSVKNVIGFDEGTFICRLLLVESSFSQY